MFESKTIDHLKLLDQLVTLLKTIGKTLVLPTSRFNFLFDNVEEYLNTKPYLGYRFEKKIESLIADKLMTKSKEIGLRKTCQKFSLALFKQLQQRLLDNIATLKNISLFSVNNVLQPVKDIPAFCNVMKYLGASNKTIASAE